jgi:hypothetical protein
MLDKNYTDISLSNQNYSTTGSISTYSAKYVPAAILLNIELVGFWSFRLRVSIIDLKDERLLACFENYKFKAKKKRWKKIIKDLSFFVE